MTVPLAVLDLAPLVAGGTAGDALHRTIDLARRADQAGYSRYWVAEHHLTPGVASSQPALLLGQLAAATGRIRLGSGAIQTGYLTPLAIVEQFGMLDALYPGRFDLGLGRSAQKASAVVPREARVVDGLLIPKPFSFAKIRASARSKLFASLLQLPGTEPPAFTEVLDRLQALLAGPVTDGEGNEARAVPGEGAGLQLWLLGSSGGESAQEAGARGLPFAANYHVAPASVLEAVGAYRDAFRPGVLPEPYVMVSADVLVAPDDSTARELATPYALWVHSIRTGRGAIPYPSPAAAAAVYESWSAEDHDLVADRLATRFAGSPATVAERLETLQRVTGADELLVTTMTYEHADRVRSFELLAKEWF